LARCAARRIGVDSRYFSHSFGGEHDLVKVAKEDLAAMQSLGAKLVPTDTGNPFKLNFKFYSRTALRDPVAK
jgi:hypothetical protein